ncbi:esterase-like activity of phytase family protein [Arenibaculum pallidiluteum]|uniref:esterase-like activity of phytase family protein n=1 Tax=Arenibaculum pallidiluteum TaxID=2812559 RepID=UPI001A96773D|nr:esterase-like activity of phytase family protein [Arenibaculum pallidiluteum]
MRRALLPTLLACALLAAAPGRDAAAQGTAAHGTTAPGATAPAIEVFASEEPALSLGQVSFERGKTLDLSVGIGSGAFRRADEPDGTFWTIGDRGPNFTCGDAEGIIGIPGEAFCGDLAKQGRIYPVPDYTPSIYRIQLAGGGFRVVDRIPLKDRSGKPVTGLLNPLTVASTEVPVDARGRRIDQDPSAVDAEGLVRLADGTFWVGDENGPSMIHVAADGRILRRLVPAGTEGDYRAAGYEVAGALPAILARRALNRGIESMAVSADERFLFVVMQNPLANPDNAAYADARNTRLLKFDREAGRVVAEYVYELTPVAEFRGEGGKRQNTPRISELLWLAEDRLLLLDRTERTTKLFVVDLAGATDILGSRWDDAGTAPSLERTPLAEAGIRPVGKRLVLDTAGLPAIPTKIEGMARFADGSLMLVNDDDFGIEGARTKVIRIRGLDLPK